MTTRFARSSRAILGAAFTVAICAPAMADPRTNEFIYDQLRRECAAKGGTFDNHRCVLPQDQSSRPASSDHDGAALGTIILLGGLYALYCKANPHKC